MRTTPLATALARLALLGGIAIWVAVAVATAGPPAQPVGRLDLQRYAGTWFEIARTPNKLQERCIGDVTFTYAPLGDGSARLVRRCRETGDQWGVTAGDAVHEDGDTTGARFALSYVPAWLRWWPQARDRHWVVLLADDYRYAVVSDPARRSVWILARTPSLDRGTYAGIVDMLRDRKFPVDRLVATPQRAEQAPGLPVAVRPPLIV
jgi:apolipoprotein D and lipocalin family protein